MPTYRMVVLTNPVAGREDEYNEWYTNRHLGEVVAVPGFVAAQRFALREQIIGEFKQRYLAIYEIETDDPDTLMQDLMSRSDTMVISDALNTDGVAALFESCSPKVSSAIAVAKG